jgi:dTDP-4-dehydrorhamnose 3,5-epimerase
MTPANSELEPHYKQDRATVTATGQSTATLPHGVSVRDLALHTDDRGTVCELYDPRWGWHDAPLLYSYMFTVRPGIVKGWGMHKLHEDRYCLISGEMKLVLYDGRSDSPTFGLVAQIYLSAQRRQIVNIPIGVWHADENVGSVDVVAINFPTRLYDHESPDKYRLPVDTDLIPHRFRNPHGG